MRKIKIFLMFVAASALVTVSVINFKLGSADYNNKSRMSLLTLEALSNDEVYDGGELPTITIICSSSDYGQCYRLDPQEQYTGTCWWKCFVSFATCYLYVVKSKF
jgi:hypothetical protein